MSHATLTAPFADREITVVDPRIALRSARAMCGSQPLAARQLASEIRDSARMSGDRLLEAEAQFVRGNSFYYAGDFQSALDEYRAGQEIAANLDAPTLLGDFRHGIASSLTSLGNFAEGIEQYYQALELRRDAGDSPGESRTLCSLAAAHGTLGLYAETGGFLTEALRVIEHNGTPADKLAVLNNLGLLHQRLNDPVQARQFWTQALEIAGALKRYLSTVNVCYNLAELELDSDHPQGAVAYLWRGYRLARKLENPSLQAMVLGGFARLFIKTDRSARAEEVLNRGLRLSDRGVEPAVTLTLLEAQTSLFLAGARFAEARTTLTRSIDLAREANLLENLAAGYRLFWRLAEAEGEYQEALGYCQQHYEVEQQMERQAAQNRLIAQTARLDVERARQEAEIYRLRNVELAAAMQEKESLLRQVQQQAVRDALTGLYNRRYLDEYLGTRFTAAVAEQTLLSVAVADLDNFKSINDRFSHRVGDAVLRTTARLFVEHCRTEDVVVRYGGEEFVVVFPDTDAATAQEILETVRQAVAAYPWQQYHPDLMVTVSIGISDDLMLPNHEHLLARADKFLYDAKSSGKNRICR